MGQQILSGGTHEDIIHVMMDDGLLWGCMDQGQPCREFLAKHWTVLHLLGKDLPVVSLPWALSVDGGNQESKTQGIVRMEGNLEKTILDVDNGQLPVSQEHHRGGHASLERARIFNDIINVSEFMEEPPFGFIRFLDDKHRGVPWCCGLLDVALGELLSTSSESAFNFCLESSHCSTQTRTSVFHQFLGRAFLSGRSPKILRKVWDVNCDLPLGHQVSPQ